MATIQIVIDGPLLERLDRELQGKSKQRSAFVRDAIDAALRRAETERDEEEWVESYRQQPVDRKELAAWEAVQDWGDPWDDIE
jgi:metal-responsive CopG/Arc/MetJ family transcriptional regulator